MSNTFTRRIDRLGRYIDHIVQSDLIYHFIFWLVFYFFLIILNQSTIRDLSYNMLFNFFNISFYAIIVYANLLYLFPKYLTQNNIIKYIVFLLLTVVAISPLKTLALYSISEDKIMLQDYMMDRISAHFLTSFFIGCSSTIYKIINDWFQHQREKVDLQSQTLKSELRFLKSQINPHFLFNTLNSLYALTLKKSDQAPEIVLRLSEMMRYMLYECNERRVPLSKEINYIKNYLELEKIRQAGKYKIEFNFTGEIRNQKIAPLMFIPFLENSFKHGLNSQAKEGYVHIDMDIKNENVRLMIENSKAPALPSRNHKKSGGIGLVNVQRRLNLMYPEDYELNISESPNSYKVDLSIQL